MIVTVFLFLTLSYFGVVFYLWKTWPKRDTVYVLIYKLKNDKSISFYRSYRFCDIQKKQKEIAQSTIFVKAFQYEIL